MRSWYRNSLFDGALEARMRAEHTLHLENVARTRAEWPALAHIDDAMHFRDPDYERALRLAGLPPPPN